MNRCVGHKSGFTLLEALVALTLMAVLTGLTYSGAWSMQNTARIIEDERDSISKLTLLFDHLERDISRATDIKVNTLNSGDGLTWSLSYNRVEDSSVIGAGASGLVAYRTVADGSLEAAMWPYPFVHGEPSIYPVIAGVSHFSAETVTRRLMDNEVEVTAVKITVTVKSENSQIQVERLFSVL